MPEITLPFELEANTPARASEVMANFNSIVTTVNGGLEAVNLADNSVSGGKLQNNAVSTDKLQDEAVTAEKLGVGAVTSLRIAAGAVTGTKLGTASVSSDKLGTSSVSSEKIAGLAVTESKIATGAVTRTKVAAGTLTPDRTTFASHMPTDTVFAHSRVHGTSGNIIDTPNVPEDWSGERLSTGVYRITTPGFGATSTVVANITSTASVAPALFCAVRMINEGSFDVAIYDTAGNLTNATFSFWFAGRK